MFVIFLHEFQIYNCYIIVYISRIRTTIRARIILESVSSLSYTTFGYTRCNIRQCPHKVLFFFFIYIVYFVQVNTASGSPFPALPIRRATELILRLLVIVRLLYFIYILCSIVAFRYIKSNYVIFVNWFLFHLV